MRPRLFLAFLVGFLLGSFLFAASGCYDTTKPTPPCTVNSPNPACPDWPHDMRAPDGGAR